MLQDFFIGAFEFLHGNQNSLFRDKVYQPAGIALLLITLGVVLVYYYGINFFRARYARRSYWLVTAAISAVLCVVAAMAAVHAAEGLGLLEAASASFYLIDALYAILLFFLFPCCLSGGRGMRGGRHFSGLGTQDRLLLLHAQGSANTAARGR